MTPVAVEECSAHLSTVTTQYETLRMAALGEALPPEARSGLMLFLRRGMWAWVRELVTQNTREELARASSPSSTVTCECKAFIYVLATMAMNTLDRRTG